MNKRLALARAVYGDDAAWRDESELKWYVRRDHGAIELFDPENNSDQFCDLLAWLATKSGCSVFISHDYLQLDRHECGFFPELTHDGTASGIRHAVVQAAERCV